MISVVLMLSVSTQEARAWIGDSWSADDIAREGFVFTVSGLDWLQTRRMAELNPQYLAVKSPGPPGVVITQHGTAYEAVITPHMDFIRDKRRTEINPLIGRHPSIGRVDTYFAASFLAHALVTDVLPARWRPAWQYVSLGLESAVVVRNTMIGGTVRLPFGH